MSWLLAAEELCPEVQAGEPGLPGLTLQVPARGIHCMVGGRAQGREAYLKTLAGIIPPAAGDLTLLGHPLVGLSETPGGLLGKQLGYVARQAPLLSVLNGRENAVMPAIYHGAKRKEAEQALEPLLAEVNYRGNLLQLPAYMSALEKMQLALVRALLLQPRLLVLEDPWFSLELPDYALLDQGIRNWGQRMAVVVATDNLGFVRQNADQIVFVGSSQCLTFANWQALVTSGQPEVVDYLQHYRSAIDWKV